MTTSLPGRAIDLPVPPELAEAFGYPGPARFVAFHYDGDLDDLRFDDGALSGNGATWVFRLFCRHRAVEALLDGAGIGLQEWPATHRLVLDRLQGRASLAPAEAALDFLASQHPPEPELTPEQAHDLWARAEAAAALGEGWREVRVDVDPEEIRRSMREQRARVGRMTSWLDQCPPAPPSRDEGR